MKAIRISRRSMLGGMLALGCQPSVRAAAKDMTLRIGAMPSIFKPTFEQLGREFRRRNPHVGIELRTMARDQEDQIQGTLRQALIGELPDVSFEGMRYLRTLQRRRIGMSLKPLIDSDQEWSGDSYSESLLRNSYVDGQIGGVSAAVSFPIIYYDADRIAKVLGQAALPQDWNGLLQLVHALGRSAKPGALGGFVQHMDSCWTYMSVVTSLGGSMMNADESRLTLDESPGVTALEIFAAFGRAGQARMDMSREQARQAFAGGAIALLIDSSSSLTMLEKQVAGRFQLATAKLPIAPNGRVSAGGIAAVLCAREPQRQAEAWRYVKFVCGPSGQSIIGKSTGYLPSNDIAIQRPDLLADYYRSRPLVRPVIESLPYAAPWYVFPGRNAMKIDAVIIDAVTTVVTLAKKPHEAAATLKRTIQQLLPARPA